MSGDVHTASAVNKTTGAILWTTPLPTSRPERGGQGIAFAGGRLVIGDSDVFGIDPVTGAIVWTFRPSIYRQPGWRRLATDGTIVYCGSSFDGYLHALDGATGALKWAVKVSPDSEVGVANPVYSAGVVYAGYIDDQVSGPNVSALVMGGVIAVDAVTGSILWNRLLPKPNADISNGTYGVAAAQGRVFAWAKDGHVYLLDATNGSIVRTIAPEQLAVPPNAPQLPEAERTIAVVGDTVVVASVSNSSVAAFLLPDMKRLWIKPSVGGSAMDVVLQSPYAFVSSSGGPSVWRLATGKLVYSAPGRGINAFGAPTPDGNRFYVAGMDTLFAMRWPD